MPLREVASGDKNAADQAGRVDIVAVHGLNPWDRQEHALDTWRKPSGPKGFLWLRDALPDVVPNARVFLYEYESSPAFGSTKERFVHQANDLLENLRIERRKNATKPLILIGHSLGGILIKQALVNAHNNPKYNLLQQSTRGLAFFGTPHGGGKESLVSLGSTCARIVTAVSTNPSNDIMEVLRSGSLFSDILQESWRHQLSSYKIISFYEGVGEIVSRSSAVFGLPGDVENQVKINADHSDMCRFDLSVTKDQDNYRLVQANIEDLCDIDIATQELQRSDREDLRLVFEEIDDARKRETILESLVYGELYDRYDKIAEAHEETFEWAFDNPGPGFVPWLEAGEKIYWIRGKPGSGKSTLMKLLFNDQRTFAHFRNGASSSKHAMASYYFHDRGTSLQKSMVGLLRAILYQLLCQFDDLVLKVLPMYGKSRVLGLDRLWSREEELLQALSAIIVQQEVQADACLFIDGLDEYDGDHSAFLKWMKELTNPSTKAGLRLKLCVSSRQLVQFEDALGGFPGFVIHEMTLPDISAYAESRLNAQLAMQSFQERDMGKGFATKIVEKASGVFVWVKLVVDELCYGLMEGDSAQELHQKIASVPENLEDLYMSCLRKIRPQYREQAQTLFEIVLRVQGLVTLLDLAMISESSRSLEQVRATTFQDTEIQETCHKMKRRLASRCGGLIETQEIQAEDLGQNSDNSSYAYHHLGNLGVQIVHQTAKEFLHKPEIWESVGLPLGSVNINSTILKICLQHYQRMLRHQNPFAWETPWCLKNALACAKDIEVEYSKAPTDILDQIFEALDDDRTLRDFVSAHGQRIGYIRNLNVLQWVVSADLLLYVTSKITQGKMDLSGASGSLYLQRALSPYGKPAFASISLPMVRLLLGNGAQPNREIPFQGRSTWQILLMRPVIGADEPFLNNKEAFSHWLALCVLFLDHGADPQVELPIETPFLGHYLLRWSSASAYTFPLHFVLGLARGISFGGLSELVEYLLRLGAEVNSKDSEGHDAMTLASQSFEGADAMVRRYIPLRRRFRNSLGIASSRFRSHSNSPSA